MQKEQVPITIEHKKIEIKKKRKLNPISDLVKLQFTELSIVVKNCLNWNKTHALESKPIKTLSDEKWRLKNGK